MIEIKLECSECGSSKLLTDQNRGEIYCKSCGNIIENNLINFEREWKEFDSDQAKKRRRTGLPLSYTSLDMGLKTEIGSSSEIKNLKSKVKAKFFRLRKWQFRETSMKSNLRFALSYLKVLSSNLRLTRVAEEEAAKLYTLIAYKGLTKGRNIETIMASIAYIVCKKYGIPRSVDEVCEISNLDKRVLLRMQKIVIRELKLKVIPHSPIDYLARFCSKLNLGVEIQSKAMKLLEDIEKEGLANGKDPRSIAAATLYIVAFDSKERTTQRELVDVAGITEVTVRKRYQEIVDKLNLEIIKNESRIQM